LKFSGESFTLKGRLFQEGEENYIMRALIVFVQPKLLLNVKSEDGRNM